MRFFVLIAAAMSAHPVLAEDSHHKHAHASPYAGQQARDIKALSRGDIEEILRCGGRGLAKVAELNGMPGPTHALDMGGTSVCHRSRPQRQGAFAMRCAPTP